VPTIPSRKPTNQTPKKINRVSANPDEASRDVVKAGFLAAGAAASTIVTLTLIGTTSGTGLTLAVAIATVGAVFAIALLVSAIYVAGRR
jgi:hypothetical protein